MVNVCMVRVCMVSVFGEGVCSVSQQVHIVKPVKSRMKNVIEATSTYIDGE